MYLIKSKIQHYVTKNGTAVERKDNRESRERDNLKQGLSAMITVLRERRDFHNAMHRPEIGNVSFLWGCEGNPAKKFKGGYGVSHIVAKRNSEGQDGEAVAKRMVIVIGKGTINREWGPDNARRVEIKYGGYTAELSLYFSGNQKTWLVTGFKDDK